MYRQPFKVPTLLKRSNDDEPPAKKRRLSPGLDTEDASVKKPATQVSGFRKPVATPSRPAVISSTSSATCGAAEGYFNVLWYARSTWCWTSMLTSVKAQVHYQEAQDLGR
jgi:hypothetical protein